MSQPTISPNSAVLDSVERLRARNPQAADLAALCALAVRVEPELLRWLRLLVPGADVSAESDLWTSELVGSVSVRGLALRPDAAAVLRADLRLPRWDRLRSRAAGLVDASHAGWHWSARLEEQIYRVDTEPPGADRDQRAERMVRAAIRQLAEAGARNPDPSGPPTPQEQGIARWLLAALARLPQALAASDSVAAARLAADLHIANRAPAEVTPSQADQLVQQRWLPWLLSSAASPMPVAIRFALGRLEVNPRSRLADTVSVEVPHTDPMVLDVEWTQAGQPRQQRLTFALGQRVSLAIAADRVELRTLTGQRIRVSEPRAAGERALAGFDFSAVRARHRNCVGLEHLLAEAESGMGSPAGWTILSGPAGAGKTTLACALADRLEASGWIVVEHFYGVEPAWDAPDLVAASLEAQLRAAVPFARWRDTPRQPAPSVPTDAEELVRSATVLIKGGADPSVMELATGFFIAPGQVLTVGEVLQRTDRVSVEWSGRVMPARVLAGDPKSDAIVLGVDGFGPHPVAPISADPPDVGDRMYAYGVTTARTGIVEPDSALLTYAGLVGDPGKELYRLTGAPFRPGQNGGPVLNLSTYQVCGVVKSALYREGQNDGYAIPIATALAQTGSEDLLTTNALAGAAPQVSTSQAGSDADGARVASSLATATAASGAAILVLLDGLPIDRAGVGSVPGLRPSPPTAGSAYLATTRDLKFIRERFARHDPVREIGLESHAPQVCAAMVASVADDIPFAGELTALAGGNPGRLADIIDWTRAHPGADIGLDDIPWSLTGRMTQVWPELNEEAEVGLGCLAVAGPGFTVSDAARVLSVHQRNARNLIDIARRFRLVTLNGPADHGSTVIRAEPSLAPALVEHAGEELLLRAHRLHVESVRGLPLYLSRYQVSSVVDHWAQTLEPGSEPMKMPLQWPGGEFLHRRAVQDGVAAAVTDLEATSELPGVAPVLEAARYVTTALGPIAPEEFVDLLVNQLRRPDEIGRFLVGAWHPVLAVRRVRWAEALPRWSVKLKLTAAAGPLVAGPDLLDLIRSGGQRQALSGRGVDRPRAPSLVAGGADVQVLAYPAPSTLIVVQTARSDRRYRLPSPVSWVGLLDDWAVAGSGQGPVLAVRVERPDAPRSLVGHGGAVTVAVLLGGGQLATASEDGTVRLWDLTTGQARSVRRHGAPVRHLVALTGGQLVSADDSGRVRWWPATGSAELSPPLGHHAPVTTLTTLTALTVDRAGERSVDSVLSTAADGSITRSWMVGGELRAERWAEGGPAVRHAAEQAGRLVTWDDAGRLRWWEGRAPMEVRPLEVSTGPLALFSPEAFSAEVGVAFAGGVHAYLPPTSSGDSGAQGDQAYLRALDVAVDGQVAMGGPDGVMLGDNAGHGTWSRGLGGTLPPIGVHFLGDEWLIVAWPDGRLGKQQRLTGSWEMHSLDQPIRLAGFRHSTGAVVLADGSLASFTWNVDSPVDVRRSHTLAERPSVVGLFIDQGHWAVGDAMGRAHVAGPDQQLRTVIAGTAQVTALVRMERWIVAGLADGTIVRWPPDTTGPVELIGRHDSEVTGLAVRHGVLVSASLDRTMRVWGVERRVELGRLRHVEGFHAVVPDPGSADRVVARSGDGALWVVDVAQTAEPLAEPFSVEPIAGPATSIHAEGGLLETNFGFELRASDDFELRAVEPFATSPEAPLTPAGAPSVRLEDVETDAELDPDGRLLVPRRLAAVYRLPVRIRRRYTPVTPDRFTVRITARLSVATRMRPDETRYDVECVLRYWAQARTFELDPITVTFLDREEP